jgi:hypothetical protein
VNYWGELQKDFLFKISSYFLFGKPGKNRTLFLAGKMPSKIGIKTLC